jgi:YgiT-type zinc finger domain-containing protein
MEKDCNCGGVLELELRTIMYGRYLEVNHVPVYHCDHCGRNELLNGIKPVIKRVIKQFANETQKRKIYFNDFSEYTDVLVQLSVSKKDKNQFQHLLNDRVNHLLDLMNLAQNVNDLKWYKEIQYRLCQISSEVDSTYSA